MIKLHWKQIAKINKAIDQGLTVFAAEDLGAMIKKKEVVPKKTGALEDSQTMIPVSSGNKHGIQIVYTVPYATKLYENKEGLTIHQKAEGKPKPGEKKDYYAANRNRFAQDHWLEEIVFDPKNASKLAARIKARLAGFETVDKKAQVEKPKPVEKPAESSSGGWENALRNKARGIDPGARPMAKPNPSPRPAGNGGGKVRMNPFANQRERGVD